jgi:hypothetical protein
MPLSFQIKSGLQYLATTWAIATESLPPDTATAGRREIRSAALTMVWASNTTEE